MIVERTLDQKFLAGWLLKLGHEIHQNIRSEENLASVLAATDVMVGYLKKHPALLARLKAHETQEQTTWLNELAGLAVLVNANHSELEKAIHENLLELLTLFHA